MKRICRLASSVQILRTPATGSGDLDVLIPSHQYHRVRRYLANEEFVREFSPQPFRHVWRHRSPLCPEPITVDIYFEYKWGLGFTLPSLNSQIPNPCVRRLMRAIYDKRSKSYFEREYTGRSPSEVFGLHGLRASIADELWKRGWLRLLGWFLVPMGCVVVDLKTVAATGWRRARFRWDQMRRGRGLEVAVVGVDGAGKSTLVKRLVAELPLPVTTIYMGTGRFRLSTSRSGERDSIWSAVLRFLSVHSEFLVRRIRGRIDARRGYVVVYDRHPREHRRPGCGITARLNNALARLYGRPVDCVLWLSGDLNEFHLRKPEHGVAVLERLERNLETKLSAEPEDKVEFDTARDNSEETFRKAGRVLIGLYEKKVRHGFV